MRNNRTELKELDIKESLKISAKNYARTLFVWLLALISYSLVLLALTFLFKLFYGWLLLILAFTIYLIFLTVWPFRDSLFGANKVETGYLYDLIIKRIFDLFIALPAFILLIPVLALVSIAIQIDSPGPVLYRSRRIGLNGRPFDLYRFRTMYVADCIKTNDQPRKTRVGSFLKKTALNELPQFYNVICGEMSLIGPRPITPSVAMKLNPEQRKRLVFMPGITGSAQINFNKVDDIEDVFNLDVEYIDNWSLKLDLKILFLTSFEVLFSK